MKIHPYLNFNGNCAEAFAFYERVLGGRITMKQTFGESAMKDQVPPAFQHLIMHVHLDVGDDAIMGSDATPDRYAPPQGVSVSLHIQQAAEGERVFNALAEGGRVTMPFSRTFWAAGFGMLVDRFGIPWMVNSES